MTIENTDNAAEVQRKKDELDSILEQLRELVGVHGDMLVAAAWQALMLERSALAIAAARASALAVQKTEKALRERAQLRQCPNCRAGRAQA